MTGTRKRGVCGARRRMVAGRHRPGVALTGFPMEKSTRRKSDPLAEPSLVDGLHSEHWVHGFDELFHGDSQGGPGHRPAATHSRTRGPAMETASAVAGAGCVPLACAHARRRLRVSHRVDRPQGCGRPATTARPSRCERLPRLSAWPAPRRRCTSCAVSRRPGSFGALGRRLVGLPAQLTFRRRPPH